MTEAVVNNCQPGQLINTGIQTLSELFLLPALLSSRMQTVPCILQQNGQLTDANSQQPSTGEQQYCNLPTAQLPSVGAWKPS